MMSQDVLIRLPEGNFKLTDVNINAGLTVIASHRDYCPACGFLWQTFERVALPDARGIILPDDDAGYELALVVVPHAMIVHARAYAALVAMLDAKQSRHLTPSAFTELNQLLDAAPPQIDTPSARALELSRNMSGTLTTEAEIVAYAIRLTREGYV